MKFEEAIEKINDLFIEPCIPGYSSGDFAPEFFGKIEDLEEIIEDLQETYAPKIEMTSEQKEEFFEFLEDSKEGFPSFWFAYGEELLTLYRFSEKELMQAWVHPELIEVADD